MAAGAQGERNRFEVGEVVGHRLQGGAHGCDDDQRATCGRFGLLPLPHPAQGVQPAPDGLRARAQPLVRERLPGRELDDLGLGGERAEVLLQRLRLAAGRRDQEQGLRLPQPAAPVQQCREQRGPQPLGEREIAVLPA